MLMNVSEGREYTEQDGRTNVEVAFLAIALIILILLSLLGNIAVVVAVCINQQLRDEISHRLTINLAITDLINGTFVMTSSLVSALADDWRMGPIYCEFICSVNYCVIIASMLTLFFISVDRYHAIINPLLYNEIITPRRINIMICYTWFQGFVFCIIPTIFGWVEFDYYEVICAIQWHKERDQALYYVIAAFILCFLLPGVALAVCYVKILKEVKRSSKVAQAPIGNERQKKKYSTSHKAVRSLLIIVFAYFICMTPFSVTKLIKVSWENKDFLRGSFNTAASIIEFCSSAINPLIYGIFRRDFRMAYKQLLTKFKLMARNDPSFFATVHATSDTPEVTLHEQHTKNSTITHDQNRNNSAEG